MARILIVDDSLVARRALAKILTDLGHAIVGEAADGAQAFTEYTMHRPDAVTMDLTMAGMSGAEATSKIIAAFPEARIIVVSALEERETVLNALERGARHFIIKPVSPEKIAAVLNNVLNQNLDQQKYLELVRRLRETGGLTEQGAGSSEEEEKKEMARVLIVDDSAVARKSLREIVTAQGHTVVAEAANGSQAFVEYTKHKPDIVTMDLTMQGLSGAEATSKIIASFPEARIVVISAIEERRVVLDALERGARHFIIKPITPEKVASILNNVLLQKFDQQKHLELVRKLKSMEDQSTATWPAGEQCMPPYQITRDGKLTSVRINSSLTPTSCQSLNIEIEEYLTEEPRVLFDFGLTASLDKAVLAEIDKLIASIESKSGMVKAVCRNPGFADFVGGAGSAVSLAAIIRYFPG